MTAVLERDDAEVVLHQALAEARAGRGGLVLVAGEAGMGKTTLVRAFVDRAAGRPACCRAPALRSRQGGRSGRGANRSTRDNPHGLTDRELDVLALLPLGVTNREIGARLHISPKTVAHHVSNLLAKLDVGTRAEAAVVAERLGVFADVTAPR